MHFRLNMKTELSDKIIGYHYTNPQAYRSMETGRRYHKTGLIPVQRFIREQVNGLPYEATDKAVIEGLLEPEPRSWLENPEFPNLWKELMRNICRESETMLLSFEINPEDKAYVVERVHVERELYRKAKGLGKPTKESINEAFGKYWESRVPVFGYKGCYSAPQLAIWSTIEFDRLKVEWVRQTEEVWQRVLDNDW